MAVINSKLKNLLDMVKVSNVNSFQQSQKCRVTSNFIGYSTHTSVLFQPLAINEDVFNDLYLLGSRLSTTGIRSETDAACIAPIVHYSWNS